MLIGRRKLLTGVLALAAYSRLANGQIVQFSGAASGYNNLTNWPSAANRPSWNSGTSTLSWIGPGTSGGSSTSSDVSLSRVLSNSAGITTSSNGQVIAGLNISGQVNVNHDNVIIRQCRILADGAVTINKSNVTGLIVEDNIIDGSSNSLEGIVTHSGSSFVSTNPSFIRRNYISGFENHITLWTSGTFNLTIIDNFLTACANNGSPTFDGDMIEFYTCDQVTTQHNTFDGTNAGTNHDFNSMINLSNLGAITNLSFINNLFANYSTLGPSTGWVIDADAHFGSDPLSWTFTTNGFFNGMGHSMASFIHNAVTAPNPSPNSGNFNAATIISTSGTLINGGTGQIADGVNS